MLTKNFTFLFCFFCFFSVSGCALPGESDVSSQLTIYNEQNYQVVLGETLEVTIGNPTKQCIAFPPDYGLSLSAKIDGQSAYLENLVKYQSSQEEIHLEKYGDAYDSLQLWIKPKLNTDEVTIPLQITASIHGHLCKDKKIKIEKIFTFSVSLKTK